MGMLLLSVIVIGAIVAVFWYRKLSMARRPADTPLKSHPFHAVAVKHSKVACNAVIQLEERRFLAKDAPRIPLPNCTAKNCSCRYVHYDDRRDDERRERPRWAYADGVERRSQQDRRRHAS
jgi:hypothetical protein